MDDIWLKVLTNPTIVITGCGGGLFLLAIIGSIISKAISENKLYRDATGKDDD